MTVLFSKVRLLFVSDANIFFVKKSESEKKVTVLFSKFPVFMKMDFRVASRKNGRLLDLNVANNVLGPPAPRLTQQYNQITLRDIQ